MNQEFDVSVSKTVSASPSRVWEALTDPAQVKEWMFGTDVSSDWQKGSKLTYRGMWNGKPYEDHGVIEEITPEKLLKTTYFSPLSGKEDSPENYNIISYVLAPEDGNTKVTIIQENNKSQEEADAMGNNWQQMLDVLSKFIDNAK